LPYRSHHHCLRWRLQSRRLIAWKITTVSPPIVKLLVLTSRARTVITSLFDPFAGIVAVAGLRVEMAATAGVPALKVTTQEAAPTEVPT